MVFVYSVDKFIRMLSFRMHIAFGIGSISCCSLLWVTKSNIILYMRERRRTEIIPQWIPFYYAIRIFANGFLFVRAFQHTWHLTRLGREYEKKMTSIHFVQIGSFFMINLCLVVIATQFSETKKREMERMRQERARYTSNSTLASSTNNSEPATCYAEIVKYIAHLWRRNKRRLIKKLRLYKYDNFLVFLFILSTS